MTHLTEDKPALVTAVERSYGCKPGHVHEVYGAECASTGHSPALYRSGGCEHASRLVDGLLASGDVVDVAALAQNPAVAQFLNRWDIRPAHHAHFLTSLFTATTGRGEA